MSDEDYDIVNLTPNMNEVYSGLLSRLKRDNNINLYTLLDQTVKPSFTHDTILMYTKSESAFETLKKYKGTLTELIGDETFKIIRTRESQKHNEKTKKIRQIFGNHVTIITGGKK
ncbi:MAG: hypothetical protein FWE38_00925 [Firmicutes bacterium]|nr:hypothetical protein [Bacillota bacterium]